MPPPKRGQASFAKKKVEVDPEEERRKKAEYDAAQKKKRLEAAKRFSVGGTVDLAEFMDDDPDMSVRSPRFEVLRRLHFIQTTRLRQTRSWLVSFSILGRFGPLVDVGTPSSRGRGDGVEVDARDMVCTQALPERRRLCS